ncbi:MAG: outer membrane beta-barrel domain-containing protein [Gammaproteobacteria bacterium]|nr:outer membrane beta-barrel domain-containing protein [Gammaproteobacteria bacterium]MCF6259671.1 outer membrane beta-barrel domain-containing protein [Gammaproteobacteria bacterium]
MEGRFRILFLTTILLGMCMLLVSSMAWSADVATSGDNDAVQQQVIQPQVERRTIDIDTIDTEDFAIAIFSGLYSAEDFGTNMVIGARVAYHVTERVFFEAAYAKTDTSETSYESLSGGAPLLSDNDRELTYYNASVGFNLLPGEAFIGKGWAFNTALYVIGGVGNTSFANDDRFTINFGAGYRFLATDWLAIHLDVRNHIFDTDLFGEKTTNNLEFTGGFSIFF